MSRTRVVLIAVLALILGASVVTASAASLGVLQADRMGASSAAVPGCSAGTIPVSLASSYSLANGYRIASVRFGASNFGTCAGKRVSISALDANDVVIGTPIVTTNFQPATDYSFSSPQPAITDLPGKQVRIVVVS